MSLSFDRRRPALAFTACMAAMATTGATAGCGSNAAAGGAGGSSQGRVPAVIKLKDPGNAGPLAYAKRERILEKRLKQVGARVEWGGTYASFTATIDAVRSRSVNVLEGAISPVLGYLANSDDIKIVSFSDRVTDPKAPHTDGLVVPPDSPARSLKDLVGKRIAVNKGGRGEYLLLLALEEAGVPVDRVQRVHLNPDQAASAFATGKVDAWWAIVRAYPEVVAKGARVLVHGRDLPEKDLSIIAARTELLQRHPKAVRVYVDVLRELYAEQRRSPEKFQNVFLDKGPTAVSGPRLQVELDKARYENGPRYAVAADGAYVTAVNGVFRKYGVLQVDVRPQDVIFDLARSGVPTP
ncbi:NrtA/SsuA/CpmA family ABC transporter substrate-binding protein [Thermomonospora umbrina]|uniref:Sulfonate transport system substrate-binding protein n=1 Tax=Thermomonospora umbrina TaxID=111806 RepID=A0A3D9SLS1_9ACTN|nr:NrtA/SsuA/CpmA family ABC transporter substrate-binding protein [Thermomonospora umbrina]REE96872.1 sulfonate transport system substrate-binding protein [Thermomonospora umbrina]